MCSYDGTIYPICDGVTVQECYNDKTHVICEINTNRDECEVEEEEEEEEPIPPEEIGGCPPSMDAGGQACSQGKTIEEFCKDNPSTQGCGNEPKPPFENVCMGAGPECLGELPEPEPPITPEPEP